MHPYSVKCLRTKKSPEVQGFFLCGARDEIRTRDPNLGKVVLYQLSYSRMLLSRSGANVQH